MKKRTLIAAALVLAIGAATTGGYFGWQKWDAKKKAEAAQRAAEQEAKRRIEEWQAKLKARIAEEQRENERKLCVGISQVAHRFMTFRQQGAQPAQMYQFISKNVKPDNPVYGVSRRLVEEAFKVPRMNVESNRKAQAEEFGAQTFSNCMDGKYK